MLYTTDAQLVTPKVNRPALPESQIITQAQTEAAAAKLAPRPSIQATNTDVEGAFPAQEFHWQRAVGLQIGLFFNIARHKLTYPYRKKAFPANRKGFFGLSRRSG